jgi:hypothetical protein
MSVNLAKMYMCPDRLREEMSISKRLTGEFTGLPGVDFGNGDHDARSMLERARDRALRGEAWDVAESYVKSSELRKVLVGEFGENRRVIEIGRGEWFDLPPDVDPENDPILMMSETVGGSWIVTGDREIPTVRQRLEESGTIILTDVKSAEKGVERIAEELEDLREMRRELAAFAEQYTPSPGDAAKMSDAEVYEMIGKIMQEEKARQEAVNRMMGPPKALSDGESVDKEQEGRNKEENRLQIRTSLGVMRSRGRSAEARQTGEPEGRDVREN